MNSSARTMQEHVVHVLLDAIGQSPSPAFMRDEQAPEYDWDAPSLFGPEQIERLNTLAADMAASARQALAALLESDTPFECCRLEQVYERQLAADVAAAQTVRYSMTLLEAQEKPLGLVEMDAPQARQCVARLLGATEDAVAAETAMSAVEQDLLLDIFSALVKAFSTAWVRGGGKPLQRGAVSSKANAWAADGQGEYCRVIFRLGSDGQGNVTLTLPAAAMAAVCGAVAAPAQPVEEARRHMRAYVEVSPVPVEVKLGTAAVAVRDLVDLHAGDVLVLSTTVDEPVVLVQRGKALLSGAAVVCDGHYGFRVTNRLPGLKSTKDSSPA
ncbi:MAG: FliM/FliN family flagellar motor switch protein [Planctomycetaceae bacterium]|nr:FliM/FliN family flagellar motor switch protein [Planctomycetaceae bacterium]